MTASYQESVTSLRRRLANARVVAVADLAAPDTELNAIAGVVHGDPIYAHNGDTFSIYHWDSAGGAAASSPQTVAGSTGLWVLVGGNSAAAMALIDHGGLSGLSDDDHSQYSLVDGTRAFTGVVAGVTPTLPAHLSTKDYVDSAIEGLRGKGTARALADSNIDLAVAADPGAIDGVTLADGNVVCLNGQTAGAQNGLYTAVTAVDPTTWTRTDNLAAGSSGDNAFVFIEEGTSYGDTRWWITADGVTIGTTSFTWSQFSGASELTAGDGITKTGNELAVAADVERTTNKDQNEGYVGRDANGFSALLGLTLTGFLTTLTGTHSQAANTAATTVTGLTFARTTYSTAIVLISVRRGTDESESGMLVINAPEGAAPQVDEFLGTLGAIGLTWTAGLSTDDVSLQVAVDNHDADAIAVRYTAILINEP